MYAEKEGCNFASLSTVSERVVIGNAVEVELGERRGGDQKSNAKILALDPNEGKRTDEIAAEKAGFGSKETYRQAKKVVETATPELVEAALHCNRNL